MLGPQRRWDLYFLTANSACFAFRPFLWNINNVWVRTNCVHNTDRHPCIANFFERRHELSSLDNHQESLAQDALQWETCHQQQCRSLRWSVAVPWLVTKYFCCMIAIWTLTCFYPPPIHLNRIQLAVKFGQEPALVPSLLNNELDKWFFVFKILLISYHFSHAAVHVQGRSEERRVGKEC